MNLVKKDSEKEKTVGVLFEKYMDKLVSENIKFDRNYKSGPEIEYRWFDFHKLYSFDEGKLLDTMQVMGNDYLDKHGITHFDFNKKSVRHNHFTTP